MDIKKLSEWYTVSEQLKELKKKERALRKEIFNDVFPSPDEGINTLNIDDNYVPEGSYKSNIGYCYALKGVYKYTRSVVEKNIPDVKKHFPPERLNALIKYRPSLVLSEYNKLNKKQKLVFDHCLVVKPATPSLKIEEVKRGKQ
jgi:hypothetical protein